MDSLIKCFYDPKFIIALLQTNIDLKRYLYSGMWHYKHKQASCGIIRSSYLMREFAVTIEAHVLSNNFSDITILWSYHIHNPVDLPVLGVDLIAHVESHVAEVTDDTSHLLQIIIHFVLSCIICYPEDIQKTDGFIERTDWDGHNILRMIFTSKSTWKCIRNLFYFHNVT